MVKKRESRRQLRIRKALEQEVGGWWFKVHGGPFQRAGIGDLLGCVCGLFFNFEVKEPDGEPSEIQLHTLEAIRYEGGGIAAVIIEPEEAVSIVKRACKQAGRVPDASRKLRPESKARSTTIRARNR